MASPDLRAQALGERALGPLLTAGRGTSAPWSSACFRAGAASFLVDPAQDLTLADKQETISLLLACGVDIG